LAGLAVHLRAVVEARAVPARELLQLELPLRRPIVPRPDHVDHHLHARADALDEIRLAHEVAVAVEVQAERFSGAAGGRQRGLSGDRVGRGRRAGECQRGEQGHRHRERQEAAPRSRCGGNHLDD
jgi:hypothetical protein